MGKCLHIPPEQLQKHHQLQPLFVTSVPPIPYTGLLEYCWMSRWWQGLQARWGLMLDGRGSSCTEQASQKVPPQFLQTFWNAGKGQRSQGEVQVLADQLGGKQTLS